MQISVALATDLVHPAMAASSPALLDQAAPPPTSAIPAAELPLLVQVVAGNPATSAAILLSLNIHDVLIMRQLHPVLLHTVAGVPWCDLEATVHDVRRWRDALPAAVGARVTQVHFLNEPSFLAGLTALDIRECTAVTDTVVLRLPSTLCRLNVQHCGNLTPAASFTHLPSLTSLDCSYTATLDGGLAGLPPSLQELCMDGNELLPVPLPAARFRHLSALRVLSWMYAASSYACATLPSTLEVLDISDGKQPWAAATWAHFTRLRVVRAQNTAMTDASVAALPPTLVELDIWHCDKLTPAVSFTHLRALRTLRARCTGIGNASLARLPPSLASLDVSACTQLSPAAALLPDHAALQAVDASDTGIGDVFVASLPSSLTTLRIANCANVTPAADMHLLVALRELQSSGTGLHPDDAAALRARGCFAPAELAVRLDRASRNVHSMALLADSVLATTEAGGTVRLLDATDATMTEVTREGTALAVLAVLPDGRCLAVGTRTDTGIIQVWDTDANPPAWRTNIASGSKVYALAVLHDGRLAAGGLDGRIRLIDVDAGRVGGDLAMHHPAEVTALAVLRDGALASASEDTTVRVWDAASGVCVAVLAGHPRAIQALAVLASGHLASAGGDGTVRLWDAATWTCYAVLATPVNQCRSFSSVLTLVALPDGRLACGDNSGAIRVWDTQTFSPLHDVDAAIRRRVAARYLVGNVAMEGHAYSVRAMALLRDGRLASSGSDGVLRVWRLPPLP